MKGDVEDERKGVAGGWSGLKVCGGDSVESWKGREACGCGMCDYG